MSFYHRLVLDKGSIKAIASDTRLKVMKKLMEGQKTVTDLSRELGVNKSVLFRHLDVLVTENFVSRDDARKWVYYSLTWKGHEILRPDRTVVTLQLEV